MYYIIQVDVDGEKKFVYSSKLLVVNKGLAKKFYSLTKKILLADICKAVSENSPKS